MTGTLGFTGTRKGMTPKQADKVRELVASNPWSLARHGDCVGADAEFHDFCRDAGVPVVLHPAAGTKHRAFCEGATGTRPLLPPLERNDAIVEDSTVMVAAPYQMQEVQRGSGTWYTIRRSIKASTPITIVFPDGSVRS